MEVWLAIWRLTCAEADGHAPCMRKGRARRLTATLGRRPFLPGVGLTEEVQVEDDAVDGLAARRDSRRGVNYQPRQGRNVYSPRRQPWAISASGLDSPGRGERTAVPPGCHWRLARQCFVRNRARSHGQSRRAGTSATRAETIRDPGTRRDEP